MQAIKPLMTLAPMVVAGVYVSAMPLSVTVTAVATSALAFLGSVLAPSKVDQGLHHFFKADGRPEAAVLPIALLAPLVPAVGVAMVAALLAAQIARSLDWNRGLRAAVRGVFQRVEERGIQGLLDAGQRLAAGQDVRSMREEFEDGLRLLEQKVRQFWRWMELPA